MVNAERETVGEDTDQGPNVFYSVVGVLTNQSNKLHYSVVGVFTDHSKESNKDIQFG